MNALPTPTIQPPDIIRAAYAEFGVTDLAKSKWFYADVLGLVVTLETEDAVYLRAFEEYLHHSVVLRKRDTAGLIALAFRVNGQDQVQVAADYYTQLGVPVQHVPAGTTVGIGDAVRIEDPLGFPIEFFYEADHVQRLTQAYHLHGIGALTRIDHFNVMTPNVPLAREYYEKLGFRCSEDIKDSDDVTYAAWMFRKPTVHDLALTGGDGPRLHHVAWNVAERAQILNICDKLGGLRQSDLIERGPGRHGVSNAFYLYLRDPDGHRIEIYAQDYYTGDPDNPTLTWDVHDNQRRDYWGGAVVPSWYNEGSVVFGLDGVAKPVIERTDKSEAAVTIGADGFSYTRTEDGDVAGFKLGEQV